MQSSASPRNRQIHDIQCTTEEGESLLGNSSSQSQESSSKNCILKIIENRNVRKVATIIALIFEIAAFGLIITDLIVWESSFVTKNHITTLILILVILIVLSIVWCKPVQTYLNKPKKMKVEENSLVASARWKAGILNGFWRLFLTPIFAVITMEVISVIHEGQFSIKNLRNGFHHFADDWAYLGPFVVNVCSSLIAYLVAWAACTMKMHTAGYFLPLLLSTPISVVLVIIPCHLQKKNFLHEILYPTYLPPYLACDDGKNFAGTIIALICLSFVQLICSLFFVYRADLIPLIREEELFTQSYYNGPFIEQCLILNRKTEEKDNNLNPPSSYSEGARVFICTTMYQESLKEQRQLLKSIYGIAVEESKLPNPRFESHIFFDGGANGTFPSRYALQLLSLLEETLSAKIQNAKKYETDDGLQLRWKLENCLPFYIHLKDPNKYKKKKRWSQVMYMSYMIDYRRKKDKLNDENTFILTTDADVKFSRQAVEILIDRLARDGHVGAVCGRTHPIGSGPVVWYQKFDYAIGHWFQKVAEHVLGSVMCCPGCFSLYRLRALRPVLADYSSRVEKGDDFLKKDMGEDRWLCTLMDYAGWRLEYAAAADCETFCPEEFDEFYKQRRRWIPSTMANLCELCGRGLSVVKSNNAVSIFFIIYQAAMIFSTIVNPGTVILIMAAGLQYSFAPKSDTLTVFYVSLVFLIVLSLFFGYVNVYCREDTKLHVAKVLTFILSFVMAAVIVGVIVQVSIGFDFEPHTPPTETSQIIILPQKPTSQHKTQKPIDVFVHLETTISPHLPRATNTTQLPSSNHLPEVPVSTWYLGGLIGMYIIVAFLHPLEMSCILHGLWYLFCLPSGYVLLIIYSVCNLNNQSWGTREGKTIASGGESLGTISQRWWNTIKDAFNCCGCCKTQIVDKSEELEKNECTKGSVAELEEEKADEESLNDDQSVEESDYPNGVQSIEAFLQKILLEGYSQDFRRHGYDDTSFLIEVDGEELIQIGITARGHRERILDQIRDLPDQLGAPAVPVNVSDIHVLSDMYHKGKCREVVGVSSLGALPQCL